MNATVRNPAGTVVPDWVVSQVGYPPGAVTRAKAAEVFAIIHPAILKAGATAAIWMMMAAWLGFSGTFTINIAIALSIFTLLMYLGLPLVLSRTSRYVAADLSLHTYLEGQIDTHSSPIGGREAMIQVLTVPVCLAAGMTIMAGLWLWLG